MKVLLLDQTAAFLDFAIRLREAGHQVKWFVMPKKGGEPSQVGDGLGLRINNWQREMKWAEIIVCSDNARLMMEVQPYINQRFPILGPRVKHVDWELERQLGQDICEECGLAVMPGEHFNNYDKAIEFVKDNLKRYVSKPDGDADKALSYVSNSPQDMVAMLQRWKGLGKAKGFILQEFVPGIAEMAVGGWIGPGGFNNYVCENFEFKKLMNDNLGPNTGEQGTAIKYVPKGASKLFKEALAPFEDRLVSEGYCGFIDMAVIIDEEGTPRPLEFTMRPGWPLFNIQQALHDEPINWMLDLFDGIDTFAPSTEHALGVVMTIPHYPYSHLTAKELYGYPIYGLDDNNKLRDSLHPCELAWDIAPQQRGGAIRDLPMFVSAGDYLVVASGTGTSVVESKRNAYKAVKSVEIPNSVMYRTDIGDRLEKQLPELQEHGFATEWRYQ